MKILPVKIFTVELLIQNNGRAQPFLLLKDNTVLTVPQKAQLNLLSTIQMSVKICHFAVSLLFSNISPLKKGTLGFMVYIAVLVLFIQYFGNSNLNVRYCGII